jgi:hypothetical protein
MPRAYTPRTRRQDSALYRRAAARRGCVGSDVILKAALLLSRLRPGGVFNEWELTVECWRADPRRFGMVGFEDRYPDHKRVYSHFIKMAPLIGRCGVNRYRLTDEGRAEAESLS